MNPTQLTPIEEIQGPSAETIAARQELIEKSDEKWFSTHEKSNKKSNGPIC